MKKARQSLAFYDLSVEKAWL